MASAKPVPSRAALNALRGILFTTSCSVIFLAEERRRRLKIARAAIDNARKLHTVRSNRGPTALNGNEAWEGRLAGLSDDVLSLPTAPQPRNSHRRRRRDTPSGPLLHDSGFELHNHSSENAEPTSSDGSSVESKASKGQHSSGMGLDSIKLVPPASKHRETGSALRPPIVPSTSTLPRHQRPTPRQSHENDEGQISPQPRANITKSLYYGALWNLEKLLVDLEMNHADPSATATTLDLAIAAHRKLERLQAPTLRILKRFRASGIRLLRSTFESDSAKTRAVLSVLLRGCNGPLQVFYPLTRQLRETRDKEGLEKFLKFLSKGRQARYWKHGMVVFELLCEQNSNQKSLEKVKKLYQMLQAAGLFKNIVVRPEVEYKIRRFMVGIFLRAGDEASAQKELDSLYKLEPDMTKADVELQGGFIIREAALGHWDSVRTSVETLTAVADTRSSEFQAMLRTITNLISNTYSPEQLEALLRRFVCDYGISLKYHWVHLILDQHASRHQLDAMFSWLQFCSDNGFVMSDAFVQSFYAKCRKYWSFSDKSIANLHQAVRALIPSLSEPWSRKEAADSVQFEWRNWVSKSDAYTQLESLAAHKEWERLCDAYARFLLSGLGFSVRCLRLAVLGHVNREDGSTQQATFLVDEARANGHDVTEALTTLLLVRIEKGDDATELIREALRQGTRLHDSVYNKAAQALSEKGDLRGAVTMCEVAAKANGNGELLYNEYNFANLVFAYIGLAHYAPLQSILSRFSSEIEWWRGSPVCKETIKLAMKTVAMRAEVNPDDKHKHQQALYKLDEALVHAKKCRSTREDRRAVAEAFIRVIRPLAAVHEQPSQAEIHGTTVAVVERQPSEQVESAKPFYKQLITVSRHGLVAAGEA